MLFQWKSTRELLTGFGGLPIVGKILSQLPLIDRLNASEVPDAARPDISHGDVVTSYLGLLAQGENDFDHIEDVRADRFFQSALNLERVPSSPTLRQRLDQASAAEPTAHWGQAVQESSNACLRQFAHWQPLTVGGQPYIPLDVDVSPMDNSKTKKEGCSWTYKHFDGYAPNFAYLGHEGYALGIDFREGKHHCQKHTPEFLADCLDRARSILGSSGAGPEPAWKLLVRLDSGNDSTENLDVIREHGGEFLIKRNLRRGETPTSWLAVAQANQDAAGSRSFATRPGKTVYQGEVLRAPKQGHAEERIVYQVIERTITAQGQILCVPEIEVATYWTSLPDPAPELLPWYPDHGTMEQYHSEYKTDLDLERLPSGKFATNDLILHLGMLAFNILRVIGQETLAFTDLPLRSVDAFAPWSGKSLDARLSASPTGGRRPRYAETNPWGTILGQLYAVFP